MAHIKVKIEVTASDNEDFSDPLFIYEAENVTAETRTSVPDLQRVTLVKSKLVPIIGVTSIDKSSPISSLAVYNRGPGPVAVNWSNKDAPPVVNRSVLSSGELLVLSGDVIHSSSITLDSAASGIASYVDYILVERPS